MTGLGVLAALTLTACGQPAETTAPPPEKAAAPVVASPSAAVTAPVADLETACREAVSRLAGQTGETVRFEKQGSDKATVSWPAPVDGGRLSMNCNAGAGRVELSSNGRQMAVGLSAAPATPAKQEAR
ncbi:hypothetical protein [Brevundimonas sp.]|uniref:hypothetical protein n=1 Tax=Brevundimonas sp. TaxID=1871086 RepID=UPI00273093EB|nr:hypothetical protein [Brevundimonas sp.]MDP1912544.1 hypothetical protein [Brevundimonas sp.]